MTTGLLLVTHEGIGTALLQQACHILNNPLTDIQVFEVGADGKGKVANPDKRTASYNLPQLLLHTDQGRGVLILTDLPGATPCNLATRAASDEHRVVSGLSLPMLIRAWSYRESSLEKLVKLSIEGGRKAIMEPV